MRTMSERSSLGSHSVESMAVSLDGAKSKSAGSSSLPPSNPSSPLRPSASSNGGPSSPVASTGNNEAAIGSDAAHSSALASSIVPPQFTADSSSPPSASTPGLVTANSALHQDTPSSGTKEARNSRSNGLGTDVEHERPPDKAVQQSLAELPSPGGKAAPVRSVSQQHR